VLFEYWLWGESSSPSHGGGTNASLDLKAIHGFLGVLIRFWQFFVVKMRMCNFSGFATFIFFVTQHMVSSIVQLSLVGENAFTNNILSWQNFRNSSKLLIFIIQQSGFVH
jgi:hypothetical protein